MSNDYVRWVYEGPVKSFDDVVSSRWKAETWATTEAKARSNLVYQYKRDHGLSASTKITLTGKIKADN